MNKKSNVIDRSSPDFWRTFGNRAAEIRNVVAQTNAELATTTSIDGCLDWLIAMSYGGDEGSESMSMWWEVAQDAKSHDEESYLEWSDFAFTFDTVILEEIHLNHLTPELPRMANIITAPACPFTFPTISTQPIEIEV